MRRTFIRATGSEVEPTTTPRVSTKVQKEELEIMENSLTYWKNILADETKYRDALVKGTEDWERHNKNVEEAEAKIKELTEKIEEIPEASVFSSKWFDEEIKKAKDKLSTLTIGTPDWKDWKARTCPVCGKSIDPGTWDRQVLRAFGEMEDANIELLKDHQQSHGTLFTVSYIPDVQNCRKECQK